MDRLAEKAESVGRSSGNVKVGLLGGERTKGCGDDNMNAPLNRIGFCMFLTDLCPKSRRITTCHAVHLLMGLLRLWKYVQFPCYVKEKREIF